MATLIDSNSLAAAVSARRLAAEWLLRWACGDGKGRSEADPVYQYVTEGRDVGAMQHSYSSCGDLPHWLLWRLGVRLPHLNRQEGGQYRIGRNITQLAVMSERPPQPHEVLQCGDSLVVWNRPDTQDAHAVCVIGHAPPTLFTAEYGQPGAALRTHTLLQTGTGGSALQLGTAGKPGGRRVQCWLPLARLVEHASVLRVLQSVDMPALALCAPGEVIDSVAVAMAAEQSQDRKA